MPCYRNDAMICRITSGGMDWRSRMLAIARDSDRAQVGTEIEVPTLLQDYKTVVVSDPADDPESERLSG